MIRVLAAAACATLAFAIDPDRTIAQFYHTAWTIEDGAPGSISALAQTRDGYLRLGTFNGLFRFDGVRFQRDQPERGDPFPYQDIAALLATPDGGLWIGFRPYGATFLESGRGHSYGEKEGLPSSSINELARDREGAIWAGTQHGLFRFINSRWEKIGAKWGYFSEKSYDLFVDSQGKLWVNGGTDLYCLPPGAHFFQMRKLQNDWSMRQTPDGTLWMREFGKGTRAVYGLLAEFYDRSKAAITSTFWTRLVDRDGGFWMSILADPDGLRRIANPARLPNAFVGSASGVIQEFTHKDGLTGDLISSAIEDHEGNVWIATPNGLDRFRRKNVVQGPFPIPGSLTNPVLVTDVKGTIWEGSVQSLATVASDGVSLGEGLRIGPAALHRVPEMTCAWRDFEGAIWIGQTGALTRWAAGRFENVEFPVQDPAGTPWSVQSMTGDRSGDLWVSIQQHGVYRRHDRVWIPYGNLPGLPKTTAVILYTDSASRVWFGYLGNQIARLDGDRVTTFSSPDGLRVGNVLAIGGRGDHIWAAGQFGLALFDGSSFRAIAEETDADFRGVSGVVETSSGDFWLNMATGVARIPASEIVSKFRDPHHKLQYDLFDFHDGVKGPATQIRPLPSAVEAGDGRIWLSGSGGVYWINPSRIYKNPIPPPVAIEAIYSGDQRFSVFEESRLPKLPQNLRIEYTALSLSIPERVRFRYQLEGYDKDWQDGGTRRFAAYTKLPPGHFRFRVIASNNDGVWNQTGAVADIVVPSAYYQTAWFEAACAFAGLALLWGAYSYRLHQVKQQISSRLEARVSERTSLARDLHDTLLQSFQGLMLRFQAVNDLLPEGKAKDQLEQTLQRGDQAIGEGRTAVYDLRSSTLAANNLVPAVKSLGAELATPDSSPFRLVVEGDPKDVHPIIRDEIYRIAREALRNAFSHAEAHQIETEIIYGERELRLRIRDDGKGISSDVLKEGRHGHYGVCGMRERAQQIGGKLDIWSQPGAGTEIELSVASEIAYLSSAGLSLRRLFRKKTG